MDIKPKSYKFTIDDTMRIIDLGYSIKRTGQIALEEFMEHEFKNFDLASLLVELEHSFTPTTKLQITREIFYTDQPPFLRINYRNKFSNENDALIFDREFSKSGAGLHVKHAYCVLPAIYQGKGIIKKVFQISFQQYVNMGLKTISVHAALNGGAHVWARHGFVAINKKEVKIILEDARKKLSPTEFNPVEHIFNKYYVDFPNGKAFPIILWAMYEPMKAILRRANWHGELNLKNSEQFRNFMSYAFR